MKGRLKDQEGLYKHFYGYVMGICLRYAKSKDEASEILNDSFLKVFNKLNTYDSSKLFKAWLRRITVNTAIDYYRREHKHDYQLPIEKAIKEENDFDVIDQLNTEDILKLLQKLPDNYRVVFNLYEIEGYSHDEIGEMLKIPVGTSKSNLSRAKQKLRIMVMEYMSAKTVKVQGVG
jgi:RNA polymerase sigma-70 factor (ECF subfamily)